MEYITPEPKATLLNRRRFLQLAGSFSAGLWSLAGCNEGAVLQQPTVEPTPLPIEGPTATPSAETTARAGRLRIAIAIAPVLLDPARFEVIEAYPFGFAVYDGLVWIDHNLQPQPMLAESWEPAADGLSWLFRLRQGVTFHHGPGFTAADVVHTFTRLLDPQLASPLQTILGFIEGVEAVEDYLVRFRLHTPNAELPMLLATPQARIVAQDYDADRLTSQPSGTGPFRFVETVPNQRTIFVRNPDYWDSTRLYVEELQHLYIPSFANQVAALERGEIDLVLDVGIEHLERLAQNPDVAVIQTRSGRYQNLAMQVVDTPFSDNRVRQALKLCLERDVLLQNVLQGYGEIGSDQPVAPLSPDWAELPLPQQDVAQARQLLAEAGYPDGLQIELVTADAAPGMVALAQTVQVMAQRAGITIEVVLAQVSSDIYFAEYWGRAPFYVSASEYNPSTYQTFAVAYRSDSPWNETGWSSPELDELLDAASGELDDAKRKALYQQAQALIMTEGAVIIPYFQPVIVALRTTVQGFQPHPAGWIDLRDVKVGE